MGDDLQAAEGGEGAEHRLSEMGGCRHKSDEERFLYPITALMGDFRS